MEACPQMLTYFCVRSALGQDIHNSLTKFPAFNEFNAEREIVEFADGSLSPNAHVLLCTLRFGAGTSRTGDIRNSLTKFPAFNEFNAEREIVAIEFAGLNGGSYNIGHYRQFVLLRRACAMRAPTPVSLRKGALSGAP